MLIQNVSLLIYFLWCLDGSCGFIGRAADLISAHPQSVVPSVTIEEALLHLLFSHPRTPSCVLFLI